MVTLLDRRGRLFGLVNVVDALVLLLVFAVATAGLTLLLPNPLPAVAGVGAGLLVVAALLHWLFDPRGDIEERATYVDLELDREVVAPTEIGPETTVRTDGLGTLDVTAVYVPPGGSDIFRVRAGELDPYNPSLPTPRSELTDRELNVRIGGSKSTATVTGVADDPEFTMAERPVLVRADVDRTVAEELTAGLTCPPGSEPHAELASVTRYGTADADRSRAFVGVHLRGPADGDEPWLGDAETYPGDALTLRTESVRVASEIVRRGTTEEPGAPATVTAELAASVTPEQRDHLTPGLTETDDAGAELMSIEDSAGETNGSDAEQPVRLTATLPIRDCEDHLRFKGEPLRIGEEVALSFRTIRLPATVQDITEADPQADVSSASAAEPASE